MLTLQRASAGSGKTYTLAKTFIWLLITIRPEGSRSRRLRTDRELSDSLGHIIAVTFTNKATAEMKQRIVEKLAALAMAGQDGADPLKPDYMEDFCRLTGETPQNVARVCAVALKTLLNDYGDFHVSTIDSFFQTILRTFAYETDLNDSYSLELDSGFVARMGLDALLEEMDSDAPDEETAFWLNHIMDRQTEAGKNFNVFQRRMGGHAIYRTLVGVVTRMEKEDFKVVREELDAYFDSTPDFRRVYTALLDRYETPVIEAHARMRRSAEAVSAYCIDKGVDIAGSCHRYLKGHVDKSIAPLWTGPDSKQKFTPIDLAKTTLINKKTAPELCGSPFETGLRALVEEMYAARTQWLELLSSGETGLWTVYRRNLPYLGLLRGVRAHIREFLEENNTVALSETNSMLRRIIGSDDAPFIYERIGTRLNHFLIDEFQDTSRLQWDNLRPLVSESEARGNANLIIGDAKQSIYRFRNADPSLITTVVPSEFPGHKATGMSPAENTNWRSDLRVVRFNNFFFHALASGLDSRTDLEDAPQTVRPMADLYANTVQHAHHREEEGYVSINLIADSAGDDIPPHFHDIGPLITEIRARGYRQKDIAILVNTHVQEDQVVEALMGFNADLAGEGEEISFISEQALVLGASDSVRLVIAALEAIRSGSTPEIRTGEERRRKGVADWDSIRCSFNFYAMRHPGLSPAQQLSAFLRDPEDDNVLSEMLASMQAVALPALVEAIIERFIPMRQRDADAPFLAAMQDAVADFCRSYSSDIASFLEWWERKGRAIAISSPEETDAVRIMTIHKSKGLEFDCVILPAAKQKFSPTAHDVEWKWVRPALQPEGLQMPPWVPVDTDSALADTPHRQDLQQFEYLYRMDQMNSAYVAFTRAVHELHVFSGIRVGKNGVADNNTLASWLYRLCGDPAPHTGGHSGEMPEPDEITVSEDGMRITYGTPSPAPRRKETPKPEVIKGYYVNSDKGFLRYNNADLPEPAPEEDDDPRSEGNLLHAAMAGIRTPRDIHRSVTALRMKGLVRHTDAPRLEAFIADAIHSVGDRGWFDGSMLVANERPIINPRLPDMRPDRLLISPDGRRAVVVDYKFGAVHDDRRYSAQVSGYMAALLSTGRFETVEGYLWYVKEGKIEQVPLTDLEN